MILALIKAIFVSLFWAPICGGIIWFVAKLVFDTASGNLFWVSSIISYLLCVIGLFFKHKEESTCPRCKEPFAWYEEKEGTETLSEDYISQDVKDDNGIYRRKAYRIGKERDYYRSTCKECGYTTTRTELGSFKREV